MTIADILSSILADRQSGAVALAQRGLDALAACADALPRDPELAELKVKALALQLGNLRPAIGAIGALAAIAVARAKDSVSSGTSWSAALANAVLKEREILAQADQMITALAFKEIGPDRIVATCSWSMTVLQALLVMKPRLVRIGQGQGLEDGARAARWLAARGVAVELSPDGALPIAVKGADAVLVGADQVLGDGSLVNRCSTFSLALAAGYFGVPFLSACQRIKLTGNTNLDLEQADDLFKDLPSSVLPYAPLFDITPPGLIHRFLTESGALTTDQAAQIGQHIAALRQKLQED